MSDRLQAGLVRERVDARRRDLDPGEPAAVIDRRRQGVHEGDVDVAVVSATECRVALLGLVADLGRGRRRADLVEACGGERAIGDENLHGSGSYSLRNRPIPPQRTHEDHIDAGRIWNAHGSRSAERRDEKQRARTHRRGRPQQRSRVRRGAGGRASRGRSGGRGRRGGIRDLAARADPGSPRPADGLRRRNRTARRRAPRPRGPAGGQAHPRGREGDPGTRGPAQGLRRSRRSVRVGIARFDRPVCRGLGADRSRRVAAALECPAQRRRPPDRGDGRDRDDHGHQGEHARTNDPAPAGRDRVRGRRARGRRDRPCRSR